MATEDLDRVLGRSTQKNDNSHEAADRNKQTAADEKQRQDEARRLKEIEDGQKREAREEARKLERQIESALQDAWQQDHKLWPYTLRGLWLAPLTRAYVLLGVCASLLVIGFCFVGWGNRAVNYPWEKLTAMQEIANKYGAANIAKDVDYGDWQKIYWLITALFGLSLIVYLCYFGDRKNAVVIWLRNLILEPPPPTPVPEVIYVMVEESDNQVSEAQSKTKEVDSAQATEPVTADKIETADKAQEPAVEVKTKTEVKEAVVDNNLQVEEKSDVKLTDSDKEFIARDKKVYHDCTFTISKGVQDRTPYYNKKNQQNQKQNQGKEK